MRRWSAFHRFLFRLTRGRLGRRLVDNDILLLTTTGRRTGREHTVPLLYLTDGPRLVVVASYGGRPIHPAWFVNLDRQPRVTVQIGSETMAMMARSAGPEERAQWWPRIVDAYDGYSMYQSRTDREIPIVFLEPLDQG